MMVLVSIRVLKLQVRREASFVSILASGPLFELMNICGSSRLASYLYSDNFIG